MVKLLQLPLVIALFCVANGLNDGKIFNLYKNSYSGNVIYDISSFIGGGRPQNATDNLSYIKFFEREGLEPTTLTEDSGTYYWKTAGGLCSLNYPTLPEVTNNVDMLVALNGPQMFGSSACGMCFKVIGTGKGDVDKTKKGYVHNPINGTYIAYVKDVCPKCRTGTLDISDHGSGRWDISIQAVQCPVNDAKIEYTLQGSNKWYLKLQIRNERMPATTVYMYQPKSKKWSSLKRTRDGFWNLGKGAETPIKVPFHILMVAPNGVVVGDVVNAWYIGNNFPSMIIQGSGVQFPLDTNLPSA